MKITDGTTEQKHKYIHIPANSTGATIYNYFRSLFGNGTGQKQPLNYTTGVYGALPIYRIEWNSYSTMWIYHTAGAIQVTSTSSTVYPDEFFIDVTLNRT